MTGAPVDDAPSWVPGPEPDRHPAADGAPGDARPDPEDTGPPPAPDARDWRPDVLGDGFEALTLPLEDDDEGEVVATLVRYRPGDRPARPARAVLYVHGWNDYFFQRELAEFWHAQGAAFYALDLRKYGRSLRRHQTPNYVDDLRTYDEEIALALDVVTGDHGRRAHVMLMGHSTGGLVLALWTHRNPGRVTGLVLNSPWLELTGSSVARTLSTPLVQQLTRVQPKRPLITHDPGLYRRTVHLKYGGEWDYDQTWRPTPFFPIRAGWVNAILEGHATVARGLDIRVPVLMAASARSVISTRWRDDMLEADTVLDVDLLARRAVLLGPLVTVLRVPGGLHDLTLSPAPVRGLFYAEVRRWLTAYGWSDLLPHP